MASDVGGVCREAPSLVEDDNLVHANVQLFSE